MRNQSHMRIALTGGGTGGHIYPALSVAEAIRDLRPDAELLFVGSRHGPESSLAEDSGIPFAGVPIRPLSRRFSVRNLEPLALLAAGVGRAKRALDRFAPDLVIGTGGFASAPVVLAQALLRRGPLVILEGNALPGRTNLRAARFASAVCVWFEETAARLTRKGLRVEVTGVPIRKTILKRPSREDARRVLGLRPDVFTVLVAGGSQGAKTINDSIIEALPMLAEGGLQMVHLLGERDFADTAGGTMDSPNWYRALAYSSDMSAPYAAANLAICRSGISTLAELTACGLPAVLIPHPFGYGGHQKLNAEALAKRGAAVALDQKDLSAAAIAGMIMDLKSDTTRLERMSQAAQATAVPDAAERVAKLAFELAETKRIR